MSRVIISLTTIPSRMGDIWQVLDSLVNQTAQIEKIILWIPRNYRRKEFKEYVLPEVPSGVEIRHCEVDYGPATKILPTLECYRGEDVKIIYCDDDRIYHPGWAAHLIEQSNLYPDECIAEAGISVARIRGNLYKATLKYKILRLATLNLYKSWYKKKLQKMKPGIGHIDICQGFGGVLAKPHFYPEAVFDIPDILWMVDDVWLSGNLNANGVKIRKVSDSCMSTITKSSKVGALYKYSYKTYNREKADMLCVQYFQENYSLWK